MDGLDCSNHCCMILQISCTPLPWIPGREKLCWLLYFFIISISSFWLSFIYMYGMGCSCGLGEFSLCDSSSCKPLLLSFWSTCFDIAAVFRVLVSFRSKCLIYAGIRALLPKWQTSLWILRFSVATNYWYRIIFIENHTHDELLT